jgi:hypothetical protein
MCGSYWLHLSDLTNRKETPPFSPAGPHIRSGLLEPHLFKNSASEFTLKLNLFSFFSLNIRFESWNGGHTLCTTVQYFFLLWFSFLYRIYNTLARKLTVRLPFFSIWYMMERDWRGLSQKRRGDKIFLTRNNKQILIPLHTQLSLPLIYFHQWWPSFYVML